MNRVGMYQGMVEDLKKKMVFVSGPRQVGKTSLAKQIGEKLGSAQYLNFDALEDKLTMARAEWSRKSNLVILDEIHKMKHWKNTLKGVYDKEGVHPKILVTGSTKLDIYRRGGDSLAGRYFLHRLYPFSVRELRGSAKPKEILEQLMRFGGFPEPYLSQSEDHAARWRLQYLERVVREDVRDLFMITDIQSMITLVELLRDRVGSTISYASLARDLSVAPATVKRWIELLENMYVVFSVRPYHRNIARSLLKEPKVYFYDTGAVRGNEGAKLENAVAVCLRKHLHRIEDTKGQKTQLHYVRDKEKREVDFLSLVDGKPVSLIEVTLSDQEISRALLYYQAKIGAKETVQLVHRCPGPKTIGKLQIEVAGEWLDRLSL